MTLGEKQELFARLVPRLIDWVHDQGWKLRLGDGNVDGKCGHMRGSLHYSRLAHDFLIFDPEYITDGLDHRYIRMGHYWLSLHPLCRWGGHFGDGYDADDPKTWKITGKDSNHVSLTHGGKG